ncbi:MAG TPA: hypothetical protein VLL05_01565, partial [Terriglobales bacterium]|nr:hypothetical protein [Terriglobales bacterium]
GVARYRSKKGSASGFSRWPVRPPRRFAFSSSVSSMSALLYQRGLLPLHGSAVVTQWGAMMFVGPQGSGKSTLAAEFHRCGYRLLSDDVCAVESRPEGLRILPALTQFRLCATAYQYLGAPPEARFDVDKFAVPMGEKYCPHPAPLRAIHILSDDTGESPRFEVVRGLDRVRCLFENLYRPHFLKGQRTQKDLVGLVGVIAQRTTVAVVSRKRDITAITDLVRFLESTWDERFGTSSNPREEFNAPLRS